MRGGEMTRQIAFALDGSLLAALGDYGLKFFDAANEYKLLRSTPYRNETCIAFSADGKTYATGDALGVVALFDTATDQVIRRSALIGGGKAAPSWRASK